MVKQRISLDAAGYIVDYATSTNRKRQADVVIDYLLLIITSICALCSRWPLLKEKKNEK